MPDFFGGGDTTTTAANKPWSGLTPYLSGSRWNPQTKKWEGMQNTVFNPVTGQTENRGNIVGTMSEAERIYRTQMPETLEGVQQYGQTATNVGQNILGGGYDVSRLNLNAINPVAARAAQGELDPTASLSRLLSGSVDNPYLNAQAQAITNQVNSNLMNTLLPQIRGGATAAGQYGGSRQGIAQAGAISGTQRQLSDALANLYGGAYENAQQRMMGTALPLNQQAVDISSQNIQNQLAQARFNAAAQQQNLANQLQGLQTLYGGVTAPYNFQTGALQNYANILNPATGYSTQTQTQEGQGPIPGMIGTALALAPLFSDRRLKKDVKLIGKFKNGLNKYSWTYLWGEKAIGAMADEVEKLIPEAVGEMLGFKTVNYSLIGE